MQATSLASNGTSLQKHYILLPAVDPAMKLSLHRHKFLKQNKNKIAEPLQQVRPHHLPHRNQNHRHPVT